MAHVAACSSQEKQPCKAQASTCHEGRSITSFFNWFCTWTKWQRMRSWEKIFFSFFFTAEINTYINSGFGWAISPLAPTAGTRHPSSCCCPGVGNCGTTAGKGWTPSSDPQKRPGALRDSLVTSACWKESRGCLREQQSGEEVGREGDLHVIAACFHSDGTVTNCAVTFPCTVLTTHQQGANSKVLHDKRPGITA